MRKRTVTGKLLDSSGNAVQQAAVVFSPVTFPPTSEALYDFTEVPATTDGNGEFSVSLYAAEEGELVVWRVSIPTISDAPYIFNLPYAETPIALASLVTSPIAYSDSDWELIKEAVELYSKYRPRLVRSTITADEAFVYLPDVIAIVSCSYGEERGTETSASSKVWWWKAPYLFLDPAPESPTQITLLAKRYHTPNEADRSYSTIPAADWGIIKLLVEARKIELDEVEYTAGQVSVKSPSFLKAAALRARALALLSSPEVLWASV